MQKFTWGILLITVATLVAYANSFHGPFVFDDQGAIVENPTIRQLWPPGGVLSPPSGGLTVSGRPLVNLSLGLNYALGGTRVEGYHLVNLAIHLLAALTLWGILRRTPGFETGPALAGALLWAVHPIQTEAVTYVIQRAESLMGLFYLFTLYCLIRQSTEQRSRFGWLAVLACFAGMATKEVMVSAPVVALLYDRTFLSGSFRQAWRSRGPLYIGLAASWVLLVYVAISNGVARGGSTGLMAGESWVRYAAAQFPVIVHYLRLSLWPHPLIFNYGAALRISTVHLVLSVFAVSGIVTIVVWLLAARTRRFAWGLAGAWFFAVLAPTSLIPVTAQVAAEHRMYLAMVPLAAIGARIFFSAGPQFGTAATVIAAGLFVWMTSVRNEDYRTELKLWSKTVAENPGVPENQNALGVALLNAGHPDEAALHWAAAISLAPNYAPAHNNLGNLWEHTPGRQIDARAEYESAVRWDPANVTARDNLAHLFESSQGDLPKAIAQYREVVELRPASAEAHTNLANALQKSPFGLPQAISEYRRALELNPRLAQVHDNLGVALYSEGQIAEAAAEYQAALAIDPGLARAHSNLGNAFNAEGHPAEAISQYEAAIRLDPGLASAHFNLAVTLINLGTPEGAQTAADHLRKTLSLEPSNEHARELLAKLQ